MNRLKLQLPVIIALVFTLCILIGSFLWFTRNAGEMVKGTTEFYLETNAKSQAAAFNTKLSGQIELLELTQQYWENVDMQNFEALAARAANLGKVGNFAQVAVSGLDGQFVDTNGLFLADFSQASFFSEAVKGATVISDTVHYDAHIGDYLYIAIPILQKGTIQGVLYGRFLQSVLKELIEMVGFQETSTSLLLSSDGTIIARSQGNELVTERIANFYDIGTSWGLNGKTTLSDIKVDVLGQKTITLPYKTGSRSRLAILTPVGRNDWYYAVVISQEIISRQSRTLSNNLIIVEVLLSVAFVLLLITILHLLRHNALVEMTNDRFRMVSTQTQAIVFDYDFQKKRIDFNGNVKFIHSDAKDTYTTEALKHIFASILHESDQSVLEEFSELQHNKETAILREMRLKCADETFYWYRITGTIIRAEDGKPLRLVGNLVNVEDEINKEQQLKKRAEIDQLSGLLNKGAFTSYVSEVLENSSEDNIYAFYIIDLDNFKKVNDTLGHIVGDHVIEDVSQKICTVFNENDYVGRIGGDEFAVFLKLSGSGKQIAQKVIEAKANAACALINEIYTDGVNEVNISSSIGVSVFPKNGKKFDELYKSADKELYLSKNGGKNQYHICK